MRSSADALRTLYLRDMQHGFLHPGRWFVCLVGILLIGMSIAREVRAQTRGALAGVVRDSAGIPIANAVIQAGRDGERTQTRADGSFVLPLENGTHFVTARRIGFIPETRRIVIASDTVHADFALIPLPRVLPVVVAKASRGGISGVIHDSVLIGVAGVRVSALGSGRGDATTDSTGAFYLDARPGKYMLEIMKEGFRPRMVSVTVSRDSGRHVVVGIARSIRASAARENVARMGLRERMIRVTRSNQVFTREDLDRMGNKELADLAAYSAARVVPDHCAADINGESGRSEPLWAIRLEDAELVEIHAVTGRAANYGAASTRAPPNPRNPRTIGYGSCPYIVVWLRR